MYCVRTLGLGPYPTDAVAGEAWSRTSPVRPLPSSASMACFDGVGELQPARREQLDPVVGKGVVRRGHHRPGDTAPGRRPCHGGTGQHTEVDDVGTFARHAGREGGLQQRARPTGVTTDDEGRRPGAPGQRPVPGPTRARRRVRRWRLRGCRPFRTGGPRPTTASSTEALCGPFSGRTSCFPSHGRHG